MAGTALGMLLFPQLISYLLGEYGFTGSLLLLGVLGLHAAVGAILLQPAKWHMKEEPLSIELMEHTNGGLEVSVMNTIEEKDDDDDELPEMNRLLFNNRSVGKRLNDNGSNTSPGIIITRPTFPRVTSAINEYSLASGYNPRKPPSFPRITSAISMNTAVQQRRKSVINASSIFDFTGGSGFQIHIDTGDKEAEEECAYLRKVSTHLSMSNFNRDSFAKLPDRVASGIELGKLEAEEKTKQTFCSRFLELMDVGLLKDRSYLNLLFGLSIFYVAEMNFKMVTPFFLANLGYQKADIATCLSISALTDILARVIVPPICDRINITKRMIFMFAIFWVAITRSIIAEQTTWVGIITMLSISGFFRGIALSNFTLTVSEAVSLERLPAAFGWHMVGKALFVILFGPLIGKNQTLLGIIKL